MADWYAAVSYLIPETLVPSILRLTRIANRLTRPESGKDFKPRIFHKSVIEQGGHVIGGADTSSVLPGDFVLPSDEFSQKPLLVKLESLDLFLAKDSGQTTPTKETSTPLSGTSELSPILTYSAMMRFSVDADGEEKKEVNFVLSNDVYFVTAHPCIPSSHTDLLKSRTSPFFFQTRTGSSEAFIGM